MTRCYVCGDPIDPTKRMSWQVTETHSRITGVRSSGKSGGRDFRGPSKLIQRWAHDHCLDLLAAGLVNQETLTV